MSVDDTSGVSASTDMTVGLAGLCAAGLAHVGAEAFAEGNEGLDVGAHFVSDADDHLEVGANTGAVRPMIGPIEIVIARRAPSGQSGIDSPATNRRMI